MKAANGQTATLIRKTPRENRAILEISVDDSKVVSLRAKDVREGGGGTEKGRRYGEG